MRQLPDEMEDVVNHALHDRGIRIAVQEITRLIPVSTGKHGIRKKLHAKNSKWSKSEKSNLGFTIRTRGGAANKKGSFGYLVFPNDGRGSSNPMKQEFAERGVVAASPKIMNLLNQNIERKIQEVLTNG
ncbi:hypothetical protein A3781_17350 [Bacillus badius]|nr:hypothetical protein [Bacillus badius]KZR58455.1 hypothetical protein A3781_17350 [Bacillus badius]